ncbi:MBL fold metallo-hydrolase [Aestuariivivens sediminicola]|uniref:MBL fold metallo-hydrolase n=1 Tax=Aestuariivivens sediminicola TaxID=2913560 RepID=UPI001F5954AB|nr:MBL fold metallo-hydrolase [Aestuariivivens sediminicola]
MNHLFRTITPFLLLLFFTTGAQNNAVVIKTLKMAEHIYMLEGQGGNIGISVGDEGVLMIDSQFAHVTPKIREAIRALSDKPIKFLVNTHHHGDHSGGNSNIAKGNTTIIAHDNVRWRIEHQEKDALPVITYSDKLHIYLNGEQVLVVHFDNAHTDGDSMLYFTDSNVLHTGDVFFHERYPYIDLTSGGSVNGYIDAVKKALILIDEDTKIIPGHGHPSDKKAYRFFLSMLEDLRTKILHEIKDGKSEEEVAVNTALTKAYDDLGYSWNFISSEKIRRTFYRSLKE